MKRGYIVIVETDDLIRELLERWLGEAGYAVVAAAAGAPAQEQPVRLVIVNISSPRGAEATNSVAAGELYGTHPCRSRHGFGAVSRAPRTLPSKLGVRKVLPKPFTRVELLVAVRESIEDP